MGVVTGLYRVKAETLKKLEAKPELMDWILGYTQNLRIGEELGFEPGRVPPQLGLDKAWDEILILLAGTDHHEAYQALHICLWEEYDGYEEVRLFSPDEVKSGLAALEKLSLDQLRSEALRRDLRTYNGDPVYYLLDYTLGHLESLREFWRAAAAAGEGIISETG